MICKARSCAKLLGMIDVYHEPIGQVSGSHQLGRTLHEKITFFTCGHGLGKQRTMTCGVMVGVESQELCLFGWSHLSILRPRCTGHQLYKRTQDARHVGRRMFIDLLPQPCTWILLPQSDCTTSSRGEPLARVVVWCT